jgi:hypothetical protein
MNFDSSILTHVFRYDLFIHWMSFIFTLRFMLIQFAQTFLSFVSIAYELAPGNTLFWEYGLLGLEKKSFGALLALSLAVH